MGAAAADPSLSAAREGLAGSLAAEPAAAAAHFDRQAELLRRARQYRAVPQALSRAGESWEQAGKPAPATDRFYRAARSFHGRGETGRARELAGRALESATRAGDGQLQQRVEALLREIGPAGPETRASP